MLPTASHGRAMPRARSVMWRDAHAGLANQFTLLSVHYVGYLSTEKTPFNALR